MNKNIYMTLNQKIFDRLRDGVSHPEQSFTSTNSIFNSFDKLIGTEYLRLITPSEMFDPRSKNPANIYKLNLETMRIEPVDETFESPVLVMIDENGFLPNFSMYEIERQHRFYRDMIDQGRIGHMINTPDSKETNDKKLLPVLFGDFNPPDQYVLSNSKQLTDLVNDIGSVVVKHRFGSDGENFYIVNSGNVYYVNEIIGSRMDEFVYQPYIPIESESRLVVMNGDVVGTRIIEDRYRPGEDRSLVTRRHTRRVYEPSEQEISDTLKITKIAGLEIGSVDWIYLNGERKLLEINDAGTGMITRGNSPNELIYNLSDIFVETVKKHL